MDDLDVLARDLGFVARGKSNPMKSGAQSDRQSIDEPLFDDVFGGPPKYTSSSNTNNNKQSFMSELDYDSIFKSSEPKNNTNSSSNSKSNNMASSLPVYDKPVYDDDIFDGLPGLKNKTGRSTMRFGDNVFASVSSPPRSNSVNQKSDFDELLGNFGRNEKVGENYRSSSVKSNSNAKGFDDLLAGYATGSSAASNRPMPVSSRGSVPIASSKRGNDLDNPFVVLESSRIPGSSSPGVFMDSLDDINKLRESRSVKAEASSGSGGAFDDLDPLNRFGKAARSFSPGRNGSPSRAPSAQSDTTREQKRSSSFIYSESNTEKKIPVDDFHEPPFFDMPNVSTDFHESFSQPISPQYYETGSNIDVSPSSEEQGEQSDDVWLTVSEIPLFTQPTAAPPPSRPPPPLPRRQKSKLETSTFSSGSRKKGGEFLSPTIHNQHPQNPKVAPAPAKGPPVSPFDEIDDFSIGKSWNSVDGSANFQYSEETDAFSAAAASAAAMKDAMDKAEAKLRHAKEVSEKYAKTARNKESVQLENDEHDGEDSEFGENQERLERESKQKEDEEREQMRLKRDQQRSRDLERERGRKAVERANREARERAAAEARERAAAETRLKAERAAVAKANAEARGRAEKVAVQRVQAEARERAAAEAKERAEKAAAEARERAAAEARERASTEAMERAAAAREKDLRDKAAVAKAEAEARRRSERAAVDRAAAEARERASVEARERAAVAAAAKINQQNNDNDLESFFSMGRASSAPRTRKNSAFSSFDEQFQKDQNKGGYDPPRWTSDSTEPSSNMKKASSATNIVDDLSSIFGGGPSSGEFQDVVGETEERRRARLDRHQRTQERAAKALAEKNQRDLQVQRDQEERNRISETLDFEIRRWAAGKEGNLRALLSTLQYVLWPECGWQPVSLTDLIIGASVKKVYRKATLCIHPDKVQQKGATLQQKFIAEKVFDMLKEAWNKFNSEELF